jgi:nitrite reductase/ring-hydroxylating ferredoxin subunit
MQSHGGNVEFLSLDNDTAHLRLVGHCESCPSSAVTLELALKQAIEEACPDLLGFECEGVAQTPANHESHIPNAAPSWSVLELQELKDGELVPVHAGGVPLVLYKTEGRLYAYRDRCPACNMPLHLGILDRTLLSCRAGHRYDVQRAGRALDSANLHLDPFPLLDNGDTVKVALPSVRNSAAEHDVIEKGLAPAG